MDIMWWLEQIGALSRTIDQVRNPRVARREPSIQLRGEASTADLNLASLNEAGVVITGRLTGADGHLVRLGDNLPVTLAAAEGLDPVLARCVAIPEDAAGWVTTLHGLIANPVAASARAAIGARMVREIHDPGQIARALDELVRRDP